jgi:hypothetical protein
VTAVLTAEQKAALDRYWAARTPAEESAAYKEMMALGLPDGYQDPHAEKLRAAEAAIIELEMLREFFDCWEALHRLAKQVAVPRRMKENAAQRLVDAADSVRAFRHPVKEPERPKLEVVKS